MANRYYRKSAVLEVGGFNEEMHVMENLDIQWKIENAGYKVVFPEGVTFFHHRPVNRFTLGYVLNNAFTYSYYWNKLRHLHPDKVGISAFPIKLVAFVISASILVFYPSILWLLFAALLFWFSFRFYRDKARVNNCINHMKGKLEKIGVLIYSFFVHILFEMVQELGKLSGSLSN